MELFVGHPEWWRDAAGHAPAAAWDGHQYQFFTQDSLIYIGPTPQAGDTITLYSIAWTENVIQLLNVFAVRDAGNVFIIAVNDSDHSSPVLNTVGTVTEPGAFADVALGSIGESYYLSIILTPAIVPPPAVPKPGFIFAPSDSLSPSPGPGSLTTIDVPDDTGDALVSASYVRTVRGMAAVFYGASTPKTLPLPEDIGQADFDGMPRQQYTWRSKKFVFPGMTTFGAAKVVHSCGGGGVRFRLYIDCCCVYETVVRGCVPFRLPAQLRGITCEIELIGCSRVTEVRVASSIRELMGDE